MTYRQPFKSYRVEQQQFVLDETAASLSNLESDFKTIKLIDPFTDPEPPIMWGIRWNKARQNALDVDEFYNSDFLTSRVTSLGSIASEYFRAVFVERCVARLVEVEKEVNSGTFTVNDYEEYRSVIVDYRLAVKSAQNLVTDEELRSLEDTWSRVNARLEERKLNVTP